YVEAMRRVGDGTARVLKAPLPAVRLRSAWSGSPTTCCVAGLHLAAQVSASGTCSLGDLVAVRAVNGFIWNHAWAFRGWGGRGQVDPPQAPTIAIVTMLTLLVNPLGRFRLASVPATLAESDG